MSLVLHGLAAVAMLTASNATVADWEQGPEAPQHHPVLSSTQAPTHKASRGSDITSPPPVKGVRPERFGAVPNDGRSDYRALQEAIDVAARRGVPVRLAADSTYDSDHWLRLVDNSKVVGAGSTSVLKFDWRKNDGQGDGYYVGNLDQLSGNRRITLARLHIMGAGSGVPSGLKAIQTAPNVPAIRMRLVDGLRIRHVEISRAPGISMLVQGSHGVHVRENYVHNSGRDGINIGWFKRDSRRVLVEDNVIRRVGDDGVAIIGAPPTGNNSTSGVQYRVLHNKILGWRVDPNGLQLGRGVSVLGARHVLIRHNVIRHPDSSGVLVAPSSRPDPWHHSPPWLSEWVRVVHNNIGSTPTAGLLIKNSTHIRWRLNTYVDLNRSVAVYSCQSCATSW